MYSLMYLISAVVSYVCAGNYAVYTYMPLYYVCTHYCMCGHMMVDALSHMTYSSPGKLHPREEHQRH